MLKSNKGVTLVALVITIIVLLILAGVSISLVVGDNGVLSNATVAVDETNRASAQSELEMAVSSVQTDFFTEYIDETSLTYTEYCTLDALDAYMSSDYTVGDTMTVTGTATSITYTSGDEAVTKGTIYVQYKGITYEFELTSNKTTNSSGKDTGAIVEYNGYYEDGSSELVSD